ncbi:MAG TPA: ATP-binding protein [Terrimicrobiaceae bacterium]
MALSKELVFERLKAAQRASRLAHAYLLTGPVGSGKSWLAERIAALVLDCAPEDVIAHPDLHAVQPESKSRRIVIEQIRQLAHTIHRKPLRAQTKVAIVYDAERMQQQAANAFLKTLEEPPPGSLILLLSTVPEAILETVISRCVETALQHSGEPQKTPHELTVVTALEQCLIHEANPSAATAFRLARSIQSIVLQVRENIASSYEALLRQETAHYKQASEDSSWLEERTAQIKALTEAGAVRERERILQAIFDAFAEALRAQHGFPSQNITVCSLAKKFSPGGLLRLLEILEVMRRRLALGVQESLAFESGFLEMISVCENAQS